MPHKALCVLTTWALAVSCLTTPEPTADLGWAGSAALSWDQTQYGGIRAGPGIISPPLSNHSHTAAMQDPGGALDAVQSEQEIDATQSNHLSSTSPMRRNFLKGDALNDLIKGDASMRRTNTISVTQAQPHWRDRVHTIWLNGPTYPKKSKVLGWWPDGDTVSGDKCNPQSSNSPYTGYTNTGGSRYCRPSLSDFQTLPQHLLVHSGRLAVVLDAAVNSGLIAKLGVVSESNSGKSSDLTGALTKAYPDLTTPLTPHRHHQSPSRCTMHHPCSTNQPI